MYKTQSCGGATFFKLYRVTGVNIISLGVESSRTMASNRGSGLLGYQLQPSRVASNASSCSNGI